MPCCWMSWKRRSSASAKNWLRTTANDSPVLFTAAVPVLRHVFHGACIELARGPEHGCGGIEDRGNRKTAVVFAAAVRIADGAGGYHAFSGGWILRTQLRLAGTGHRQRARRFCVSPGGGAGSGGLDCRA